MEYLSAKEAAEKNNLHIRTIQKWAKEGKIAGARKVGRDWLIPEEAFEPIEHTKESTKEAVVCEENEISDFIAMPVLSGKFISGTALEYIESFAHEAERKIARAEYHYFRGEATNTIRMTEGLRFSKEYNIRMSALLLHSFSSIQLQLMNDVKQDFQMIEQEVKMPKGNPSEQEQLFGHYIVVMSKVLLHDTQKLENPFEQKLQLLSDGLRFYGTYIMSHYYYLKREYQHSLGIAETALTLFGNTYPIGSIYLFLVVAMNLISLHQEEKAEQYFCMAWDIAKPDGFIEPFAEHHGLLGGLVEKCLKHAEPESYDRIVKMVYDFSEGWRQIHNPATKENVTSDLTTMEFSIAMLASKGWSNKEIGKQLNISENMVKNMTKVIYQKLKIAGRKELKQYMLK